MQSFRDVTVVPTDAMGWHPRPFELRTGPSWPDFDRQVEARHCRGLHADPYDTEPEPPAGPLPLIEEAAWCGPWCVHFGHAVADFGMRILESARLLPGVPLLFTADPRGAPPPFFWAILDAWGVDRARVRLVQEPVRAGRLHVFPQAERMHGPGPSAAYLDLLDRAASGPRDPDLAGRTVFVSRARVKTADLSGRLAGEAYLESCLAAAGAVVARPEAMTVAEQMRLFRSAGRLLFSEGSALHGLQLVGRIDAPVGVLVRRGGQRMAEGAVTARSPRVAWIDAAAGQVQGLRPDGRPDDGSGITALDSGRLLTDLAESFGLDLRPHWDEAAHARARHDDVLTWMTRRAARRHALPGGDAEQVARSLAAIPLLGDPAPLIAAASGPLPGAAEGEAARDLGAALGLDPLHFRPDGPPRGFGVLALATGCAILDVFGKTATVGEAGAGAWAGDTALHARIRRLYRNSDWMARYRALNAAFLAHESGRTVPAPLSGGEAAILGSTALGRYQVTLCEEGGRLRFLLGIGRIPLGLYHPAEGLFVVLTTFSHLVRPALRELLGHLVRHPLPWIGWLRRARAGGLRRAFLVADERPSHFIRQSLAYLDAEEAALLGFGRGGGVLVTVPEHCAMDPLAVIPALSALPHRAVPVEGLTEALLEAGLDAHRVYRHTVRPEAGFLRARLAPRLAAGAKAPGRFRVVIALDAERERVANAAEAFRALLLRLGAHCAARGLGLEVVWDGWTLSGPPTEKDRAVMARIGALAASILDGLPVLPVRQVRIDGRDALGKLEELSGCDLAVSTQGTGALLPSWLLRRPTIVFQLPGASNRDCLDEETVVEVDPRAVVAVPGDEAAVPHARRFTLAPWGMEEAMERALAGSAPPPLPPPVPSPPRRVAAPPSPAQQVAVAEAGAFLAAWMGIDARHFRAPLGERPEGFGPRALADAIEIVDPHAAGTAISPATEGLGRWMRARGGDGAVARGYEALATAFLSHAPLPGIASPLREAPMDRLCALPIGPYQVTFCRDGARLVLQIAVGHLVVGLFHAAEGRSFVLTRLRMDFRGVLRTVLAHLLDRPVAYEAWLRQAAAARLRRTFVIGDARPGHFIRQSLAYLDREEAALVRFSAGGGLLLPVPDWCAMDPSAVIPALAGLEREAVESGDLSARVLAAGYDTHRVYRFTIDRNPAWLRRRLGVEDVRRAPGRFRVAISVDAERQRVVNQVEAFRFVLGRLGGACASAGLALDIVWDGWTVGEAPSERDRAVIGRIEAAAVAILHGLDLPQGERVTLYGRAADAKVAEFARCDLALTTAGTGALLPSWLLRVPTIVWAPNDSGNWRSGLDEGTVVEVDRRAIGPAPEGDVLAARHDRITLAEWGLERALRQALAGRLDLGAAGPDAP